jgi:hypothetical protein
MAGDAANEITTCGTRCSSQTAPGRPHPTSATYVKSARDRQRSCRHKLRTRWSAIADRGMTPTSDTNELGHAEAEARA